MKTLSPLQQNAVAKIQALQLATATTGFRTTRSINELLSRLSADDLAAVSAVVFKQQ
jgi:hypothetical protein